MLDDIKKAIEKNLPAEVGVSLRKRLEEADTFECLYKETKAALDLVKVECAVAKEKLSLVVGIEQREANLVAAERKLAQDRAVLDAVTNERNARSADIFNLVSLVFRNPVLKSRVFKGGSVPVPTANGYPTTMSTTENEDREETQE